MPLNDRIQVPECCSCCVGVVAFEYVRFWSRYSDSSMFTYMKQCEGICTWSGSLRGQQTLTGLFGHKSVVGRMWINNKYHFQLGTCRRLQLVYFDGFMGRVLDVHYIN